MAAGSYQKLRLSRFETKHQAARLYRAVEPARNASMSFTVRHTG